MAGPALEPLGVVGAGQIGYGVAERAIVNGLAVRLVDVDARALDRAREAIAGHLGSQVERGRLTDAQRGAALERLQTSRDLSFLAPCPIVVEAATEDLGVKRSLYRDLAGLLGPDALIASTTSTIPLTQLGTLSDRPAAVIGMHFMYPVQALPLVEVVQGFRTSEETFAAARALAERLGKEIAVAEDFPGFIVNRILAPSINEAAYILTEGVGTVADIDRAMTLGANHPMGPLQLGDFIGLDVILAVMNQLNEGLADSKYRPCPLLQKYVKAGWTGKRAGKGFYDYSTDPPKPTR